MIIYISGPMTGYPDDNKPAFNAAAQLLRNLGHTVISPAEIEVPEPSWENYLKEDIRQLLNAEVIAMIPGWTASRGARLELHIAERLGMTVKMIGEFEAEESVS